MAHLRRKHLCRLLLGVLALTLVGCGEDPPMPPAQLAAISLLHSCGTSDYAGVTSINGQLMLVAGVDWDTPDVVHSRTELFAEFAMNDGGIATDKALCMTSTRGQATTCRGYFSPEAARSLNIAENINDALDEIREEYEIASMLAGQPIDGSRSVDVYALTIDAAVTDIVTATALATATISVPAQCPEHIDTYEPAINTKPTTLHLETLATALEQP